MLSVFSWSLDVAEIPVRDILSFQVIQSLFDMFIRGITVIYFSQDSNHVVDESLSVYLRMIALVGLGQIV